MPISQARCLSLSEMACARHTEDPVRINAITGSPSTNRRTLSLPDTLRCHRYCGQSPNIVEKMAGLPYRPVHYLPTSGLPIRHCILLLRVGLRTHSAYGLRLDWHTHGPGSDRCVPSQT